MAEYEPAPAEQEIWGDGSEKVREVLKNALAEGYITKEDLPDFEGDDLESLLGNLCVRIIEAGDDHNKVYDRWGVTDGFVE